MCGNIVAVLDCGVLSSRSVQHNLDENICGAAHVHTGDAGPWKRLPTSSLDYATTQDESLMLNWERHKQGAMGMAHEGTPGCGVSTLRVRR